MMWSSPLPIKFNFTLGLQIQLFDIQYTKKKKKKKRKEKKMQLFDNRVSSSCIDLIYFQSNKVCEVFVVHIFG